MTESYNSDFSILSFFGAHNSSNHVFRLLHARLFLMVFVRMDDLFFRGEFSFYFRLKELALAVISVVRKVSSDL